MLRAGIIGALAWWFAAAGDTTFVFTAIGPFETEQQCNQVREWARNRRGDRSHYILGWCWYSRPEA